LTTASNPLQVRVNDELVLDAGWWEEVTDASSGEITRLVHPPSVTMFEQVLAYLESRKLTHTGYKPWRIGEEAIAAVAVCLRWGSYLAVLADRDKRMSINTGANGLSRIADGEMARINIEASAALERWLDLRRSEPDRYQLLVHLAGSHLPMPRRTTRVGKEHPMLMVLTQPDVADRLRAAVSPARLREMEATTKAHPTRVLANAMINYCWRNGPIENIHAGTDYSYPMTERRIAPSEERMLVRKAAAAFAQGMLALDCLMSSDNARNWPDSVLPFQLAEMMLVTPNRWSLTETTRGLELPGREFFKAR
jgi:hypothetical protein